MKFRKNWKRFWTLDRRHAEGFTLVELIVVIAILAILAGVGTVGYSGYVKKANMQADMTLISEIEQALTLAHYSGDLTEGTSGFLMLSPANSSVGFEYDRESFTTQAMSNAFGTNWEQMMQLKYDGWSVKSQMLSYEDATAVVNSNFVQKYSSNELMAQVQAMTDAVNGLKLDIGDTTIQLYDMFGYADDNGTSQNAIIDVMKEYGIGESEDDWNALSATEKSNLLVLATASSISNGTSTGAAEFIPQYALYTAYAAENAEFNEAYKTFQAAIADVDPDSANSQVDQIKAAYKTLQAAAGSGFDSWKATNGDNNAAAFEAIMAGVGNAMVDNGDAILSELGNEDMFTTGIGNELYNDYLKIAYASAGTVGGEDPYGVADMVAYTPEGCVTVWYTVINGKIYVENTLP